MAHEELTIDIAFPPELLQRCAFCEERPPAAGHEAPLKIERHFQRGNVATTQSVRLRVPRCEGCHEYHDYYRRQTEWLKLLGGCGGALAFFLFVAAMATGGMWTPFFISLGAWAVLALLGKLIDTIQMIGVKEPEVTWTQSPAGLLETRYGRHAQEQIRRALSAPNDPDDLRWSVTSL